MIRAFENIWGNETMCAEARAANWRKMKMKRFSCLPPNEDTLLHHLDWNNYLSYLLKHYELNHHLSLIGDDWCLAATTAGALWWWQCWWKQCITVATVKTTLNDTKTLSNSLQFNFNIDLVVISISLGVSFMISSSNFTNLLS